jgi:hydrogenase maturation factor
VVYYLFSVSCRVTCDFSGGEEEGNSNIGLVQTPRVGELVLVDLPLSFEGMGEGQANETLIRYLQQNLVIRPTGQDESFTSSTPSEGT